MEALKRPPFKKNNGQVIIMFYAVSCCFFVLAAALFEFFFLDFSSISFFKRALNKALAKFCVILISSKSSVYGFSRSEIEEHMKDGIMNQGFSVSMSYNGLRLALMNKYNISRNTLKKYIEYIANKKCI